MSVLIGNLREFSCVEILFLQIVKCFSISFGLHDASWPVKGQKNTFKIWKVGNQLRVAAQMKGKAPFDLKVRLARL